MTDKDLLRSFREKVCREIDIESGGVDRYVVYVPFRFDDGDHYVVTLHRDNGSWYLSDEGHTLMHLSYREVNISQGSRAKFVDDTIDFHGLQNREGELRLDVPDEAFGDALFSFVQGLSQLATVTDWTKERVKSTFMEDFRALLQDSIPEERMTFNYHHPTLDPDGNYGVDCRVNGSAKPWHIYAVNSDARCMQAVISVMFFERAHETFRSIVMYEDQTKTGRRPVAQLSDVVDKQFSSLGERERIRDYLKKEVIGGSA